MFEKVNPYHPDKVADRVAGAITDLAYSIAGGHEANPKIATEVLIGHGHALIIIETSVPKEPLMAGIPDIMQRICPSIKPELTNVYITQQDPHLAANQVDNSRTGDNGIFRGMPVTKEQQILTDIANELTRRFQSDGKYIIKNDKLTICQSNASLHDIMLAVQGYSDKHLRHEHEGWWNMLINPLGPWTGGTDVDSGATNRKLGSDMGDAVTGGGLHGKDLSKADVSVNIVCHLLAQRAGAPVEVSCAIGDNSIKFRYINGESVIWHYDQVMKEALRYIQESHGSFEHFAEWGLIRPNY